MDVLIDPERFSLIKLDESELLSRCLILCAHLRVLADLFCN